MSRVQSVERALAVLRAIGEQPAGLVGLANAVGLPTSTTARLLATLEHHDAVRRDHDGRYHVGSGITSLVDTTASTQLLDVAGPRMRALVSRLDEAVCLSFHAGDSIVVVDQVGVPHPVRAEDWTGSRWPVHAGCSGVVLMATWPRDEVERRLRGDLHGLTARTEVEPARIRARVEEARRERIAWSHGEYVDGLSSVSAAITDQTGRGLATLVAYGPSYRFPPKGRERDIARAVRAEADAISAELRGVVGDGPHRSGVA